MTRQVVGHLAERLSGQLKAVGAGSGGGAFISPLSRPSPSGPESNQLTWLSELLYSGI